MEEITGRHEILRLARELQDVERKATKWWIGPLTSLIIVFFGVAVSWGMNIMTVNQLQDRVDSLEAKQLELVIQQAGDNTLIDQIRTDILEIKGDVKSLLTRRGSRK